MTDPNTVEDGTFTLVASGSWGKVWALSPTVTPVVVTPTTGTNIQHTQILIYAATTSGQDMFVRGGIDSAWALSALGRTCTSTNMLCALGQNILNHLNNYTANWENGDTYMDWYGIQAGQGAGAEGTPLEWTTNNASNFDAKNDRDGVAPTAYSDSGVGYFPGNTYGPHYWLWDVDLDCTNAIEVTGSAGTKVKLFEFKAYVKGGAGWEGNMDTNTFTIGTESFTVHNTASNNHFAVCGKLTKTSFNSSAMTVTAVY
jgi:alpha-amylase